MERDLATNGKRTVKRISTHTLTWSVTISTYRNSRNKRISTHTLTWSVTKETSTKDNSEHISTHTLTWSVTRQFRIILYNKT